jgi:hypothetical protein
VESSKTHQAKPAKAHLGSMLPLLLMTP